METGTVYWVTGLSGAGKTTIGSVLYDRIRSRHANTVFFDGDALRKVFGDDLGYTEEDRRKCAMRYSRLCAMLARQNMNVICCTISMYDSVRAWNRENIENYREIYIKVPMDTLRERNQKGLYSGADAGTAEDVAGIQVKIEEPKCPDLVLENDGRKQPEELAGEIIEKLCLY